MNNELKLITPFKRMCITIGNLPTAYLESMSYYECLTYLLKFLTNEVIPVVNNNSEVVKELQEYVAHYFDNLDVQEEINNKLDDMADSGQLADIIAQYLSLAGVLAFDTLADLKDAENITDGSITLTLGQDSYNDGLTSFYKIRTVTVDDVVDELNIVSLNTSDTLIAERIHDSYENVKKNPLFYGADLTGTNDSSTAINNCIQANKGGTIELTSGTYLVNSTIELPFDNSEKVNINGNGSKIISTETLTDLFYYGYDRNNRNNNVGFTSYIKDLEIDCSGGNVTNAITVTTAYKDLRILNVTSYRTTNGVKLGEDTTTPSDVMIDNCLFYGKGSEYAGIGVICNNSDNCICNSRLYGFRMGVQINSGNHVVNTQVLLRWENQTNDNFDPYTRNSETFNTYYEQTMYAECNDTAKFENCYCDSMYRFLDIKTNHTITVIHCNYWNSRADVNCDLFKLSKVDHKLIVANSKFAVCKNTLGRVFNRNNVVFNNYAQIKIANNILERENNLTDPTDLILSDIPVYHNNINMSANTWYLLKIVDNVSTYNKLTQDIYMNGYEYKVRIDKNGGTITTKQFNTDESDSNWTIGLLPVNDDMYICIKGTTAYSNAKMNLVTRYSDNLVFDITPSISSFPAEASRLLSDYTDQVPSVTAVLKECLNV